MSFSGAGTGIKNADDVAFSGLVGGQTLVYSSAASKWQNAAAAAGAATTVGVSTLTSGTLTLTVGTSPQLTKLKSTLTGNLTIQFASPSANAVFDISLADTQFNGYTVTVGSDVYTQPTYVRYAYVGGAWERLA